MTTNTTLHDRLLELAKRHEDVRDALGIPSDDYVDQFEIDLLKEAAAALAVRGGFVLVPMEPTEAMYSAAQAISKPRFGLLTSSEMWSAMIAAAPQPPEEAP